MRKFKNLAKKLSDFDKNLTTKKTICADLLFKISSKSNNFFRRYSVSKFQKNHYQNFFSKKSIPARTGAGKTLYTRDPHILHYHLEVVANLGNPGIKTYCRISKKIKNSNFYVKNSISTQCMAQKSWYLDRNQLKYDTLQQGSWYNSRIQNCAHFQILYFIDLYDRILVILVTITTRPITDTPNGLIFQ